MKKQSKNHTGISEDCLEKGTNVKDKCRETIPAEYIRDILSSIRFLDTLVKIGEEAYEIDCTVLTTAHSTSTMFFGWLMDKGIDNGTEVLAMMSKGYFEFIYLDCSTKTRRPLLATATKRQLSEFIKLTEFAVPNELWENQINPFDGLILFYQFLDFLGYDADVPRRTRAIKDLRRQIKKQAISEGLSKSMDTLQ